MPAPKTILIAGATGVIGQAALERFACADHWNAIALSRRTPEEVSGGTFRHLPVDLTDPVSCQRAAADLATVTHLVYTAVAEQPGLVAGWRDAQQMQINLSMLSNLLDALVEVADLRHVTLLQGAKAYGGHTGRPSPLPARERAPRVPHENFYWLQEDYLRAKAESQGFGWTVFRPQVVIGAAWGAAMNPLLPLAAFAVLRREEGKPFSYPGGALQIGELADAELLAEAFDWAATAPAARNEIFNITNGDVFSWREAWPALADSFGVETGPDEPLCLSDYLTERRDLWDRIVQRDGLRPLNLAEYLGESHYYADILLRRTETAIGRPTLLSTVKLRQAGFAGMRDSEDSIRHWIGEMKRRRLISA